MSVYREPEGRPPTPPTVITYRTYALRLRGWMFAAVFSLLGLVLLAMIHATHLECTRSGGQDGVCVVSSYGMIVAERRRVLPLADIVALDVAVMTSKGSKTARVELRTRSERINLAGSALLTTFDYARALEARSRFTIFQSDTATPTLDLWLHGGVLKYAFVSASQPACSRSRPRS